MNSLLAFVAGGPDDPEVIQSWSQILYKYGFYTIIFIFVLVLAFIVMSVTIKHQQDQILRKWLLLVRKVGTYLAIIIWVIYVGVEVRLIPFG